MWLPRRVKKTGQRCAHCDPVPIRRPATGLNGERACGASLEPRGGEPKNHPGRITLRRGGESPGHPSMRPMMRNRAKSISAYWTGLKDTGHLRSYRRAERAIALSCKRIARNSLQNESRSTEQMGQPVRRQRRNARRGHCEIPVKDRPAAAGHCGVKRTPRQAPRSVPLPDGSCYCLQ